MDDLHSLSLHELRKRMSEAQAPAEKPAEAIALETAFAQFRKEHPDFQATAHNIQQLVNGLSWDHLPTSRDFLSAHAMAHYENRYEQPAIQVETDLGKMPINQLKNLVEGRPQVPEGAELYQMPIDDLRCLKDGAPIPSKEANEWSMPIGELKQQMQNQTQKEPLVQFAEGRTAFEV